MEERRAVFHVLDSESQPREPVGARVVADSHNANQCLAWGLGLGEWPG